MKSRIWIIQLFMISVFLAACVTPVDRERLMREEFPTYPPGTQERILAHEVSIGMTENQVILAWGETRCIYQSQMENETYNFWGYHANPGEGYPVGSECSEANSFVLFEPSRGTVVRYWMDKGLIRRQ